VLTTKSETPIDFVSMLLRCNVFIAAGADHSRAAHETTLYDREWRPEPEPAVLVPGEHRFRATSVLLELEGKLADPNDAMPTIELAVSLRPALAGIRGAGPFR
jgi:hypothetical protein